MVCSPKLWMVILLTVTLAAGVLPTTLQGVHATPTVDRSCTDYSSNTVAIGNHQPIGQVFTASQSFVVSFQIYVHSSNGVGTPMVARILSGGNGGSVLGSVSFTIPAGFGPGWIGATFPSSISVIPGAQYALDLQDQLSSAGISWYLCSTDTIGGDGYTNPIILSPNMDFMFSESSDNTASFGAVDRSCTSFSSTSVVIGTHEPIGQVFTPAQNAVSSFLIYAQSFNGVGTPMVARILNGGSGGSVLGSVSFTIPGNFNSGWIGATFPFSIPVTPGNQYALDVQDQLSSSNILWYACSSGVVGGNGYSNPTVLPSGMDFMMSESSGSASSGTVDRSCTSFSSSTVTVGTHEPIGQVFTPNQNSVSSFSVYAQSFNSFDTPMIARILNGGNGGAVLGSVSFTIPANFSPGWIGATFSSTIYVTPGNQYALDIQDQVSSSGILWYGCNSGIVGGNAYSNPSVLSSGMDFMMSEGSGNVSSGTGDFSLSVSPSYVSVSQGNTVSVAVSVSLVSGSPSQVTLAVFGAPSGVSTSFASNPVTPFASSNLNIWIQSYISTGTYTLTVTGTSGGFYHTATFQLSVSSSSAQSDFSISVSPSTMNVNQGDSGAFTLTLAPVNVYQGYGYLSSVSLGALNAPAGIAVSFNGNPVNLQSYSAVNVGASVSVQSSAPAGSYPITIAGTSSNFYHTTTITVTVGPPPEFTLTIDPTSLSVIQGASATATATVASIGSFASPVTLSSPSTPQGLAASLSSNPITPSAGGTATSTVTISTASTMTQGSYTITIQASSGSLSHQASIQVQVSAAPDFSVSVSPAAISLAQPSAGSATVTVLSTNGFNSPITLVASWLGSSPTGVTFNLASPITPQPNTSVNTILTVATSSSIPAGSYYLQIMATSGTLSHSTNLLVSVTAPQCVIATATYGTELAPEVQVLRNFRDQMLMRTYDGSQLMTLFNAWYYSWAPPVAQYESTNQPARTAMKYALYPLIGIFSLTSAVFQAANPASPEAATTLATIFASTMIGLVYLSPPLTLLGLKSKHFRNKRTQQQLTKLLMGILTVGLVALLVGEAFTIAPIVMVAGLALASSAIVLAATETSAHIVRKFAPTA